MCPELDRCQGKWIDLLCQSAGTLGLNSLYIPVEWRYYLCGLRFSPQPIGTTLNYCNQEQITVSHSTLSRKIIQWIMMVHNLVLFLISALLPPLEIGMQGSHNCIVITHQVHLLDGSQPNCLISLPWQEDIAEKVCVCERVCVCVCVCACASVISLKAGSLRCLPICERLLFPLCLGEFICH